MFYSHGQQQPPFNVADVKYDTANKGDSKFKKKSLINQVNFINQESNKKLVADIYKTSQHDLKRRSQNSASKQRVTTKESMNRSQSKNNRKNSASKQSTKELRKGLSGGTVGGSASARKLAYPSNEWAITNNTNNYANNGQNISNSNSRMPSRSTSASNLKKRSFSTNAVPNGATIGVAIAPRKADKMTDRRPIETNSKYGSSDINSRHGVSAAMLDRQKRSVSIKELLGRKLTVRR